MYLVQTNAGLIIFTSVSLGHYDPAWLILWMMLPLYLTGNMNSALLPPIFLRLSLLNILTGYWPISVFLNEFE